MNSHVYLPSLSNRPCRSDNPPGRLAWQFVLITRREGPRHLAGSERLSVRLLAVDDPGHAPLCNLEQHAAVSEIADRLSVLCDNLEAGDDVASRDHACRFVF